MNVILLSGGSEKRLWPLSNDIRSKQFIKIFKNEDGEYESMLERMYKNIKKVNNESTITIATSQTQVMKFNGKWKDLGTWNTLTEAMDEKIFGKGIENDECENTHIINELNVPILCMGLKNVVVAASSEGILVSDKEQSSYIKPYAERINQQIMFAEKSWGSYRVIDVQEKSLTILVTLNPGNRMAYHSHDFRDEVWTIISGTGKTIVDGMEQIVKAGDVITMEAGCKHTIIAETELKVIEVQLGKEISVNDKHEFKLEE